MTMPEVERLTEVSPTLVEAIRRCGLAVHLSRARQRQTGGSPSNPHARLGGAVHRVLAWVSEGGLSELPSSEVEAAVRQQWRDEVAREERAAARFPVEAYFGVADRWPGFAMIEERLIIEAGWLAAELSDTPSLERWVERSVSSTDPPMRGSPDLVIRDGAAARVIEFKSGRVEPDDAWPSGRYGRQVLMYAAMVRELGIQVTEGEIRPIGRTRAAVEINDDAMDKVCETVTAVVNTFNSAIDAGDPARLARPGDLSCGYCPHTLSCPALWAEGGTRQLDNLQVLEGTVRRVQHARVGSVAVELNATAGTRLGLVIMTGVDPRRLSAIAELRPGDQLRISGLRSGPREDSALVARQGSWVQLARIEAAERVDV